MKKVIATNHSNVKHQIQANVAKKVLRGKRVNASALFITYTAPVINKCIANYGMTEYVTDVLLCVDNANGFNRMYLEIIKSNECQRMTNDYGQGRPDEHWFHTVWCKFIDELKAEVSKTFEVSKSIAWSLHKLSPEVLQQNLKW